MSEADKPKPSRNRRRVRVMLDLETLGCKPGCIVLSIGAVAFSKEAEPIEWPAIRLMPDLWQQQEMGMGMDVGTVKWWMKQSDAAREVMQVPRSPLRMALGNFSRWIQEVCGADGTPEIWGNGASFDEPILRALYEAAGVLVPWSHYDARCYRTMKALVPHVAMERTGTHHDALDDATTQAVHLLCIEEELGKGCVLSQETEVKA